MYSGQSKAERGGTIEFRHLSFWAEYSSVTCSWWNAVPPDHHRKTLHTQLAGLGSIVA